MVVLFVFFFKAPKKKKKKKKESVTIDLRSISMNFLKAILFIAIIAIGLTTVLVKENDRKS